MKVLSIALFIAGALTMAASVLISPPVDARIISIGFPLGFSLVLWGLLISPEETK